MQKQDMTHQQKVEECIVQSQFQKKKEDCFVVEYTQREIDDDHASDTRIEYVYKLKLNLASEY